MEYAILSTIVLAIIVGVLITKIRKLKNEIASQSSTIVSLRNERNQISQKFVRYKLNIMDQRLNRYQQKVLYNDVIAYVKLRIRAEYPYSNKEKQYQAVAMLDSLLGISSSKPEYILITPTKCSKNIIEPIIAQHKSAQHKHKITLRNKPRLVFPSRPLRL